MKANELRIGNFINVPYGNNEYWVRTVEEIRTDSISTENGRWCFDSSEGNKQEFFPISLTEEWLIRLGFNLDLNSELYNKSGFDVELLTRGVEFYLGEYGSYFLYVEHVHQLQNLYFALTGEELTLKQSTK